MSGAVTKHTVKPGETIFAIASQYGIMYWPNLFWAPQNHPLAMQRKDHRNLKAGDVLTIPAKATLAALESRPSVLWSDFSYLSAQATTDTCWREVALMMVARKLPSVIQPEFYIRSKIGSLYDMRGGLDWTKSPSVYAPLGMTPVRLTSFNHLHRLLQAGPVLAAELDVMGHAMILVGYDLKAHTHTKLDPLGGSTTTVDFGSDPTGKTGGSVTVTPGKADFATMVQTRSVYKTLINADVWTY